jgi:hypothetical protein
LGRDRNGGNGGGCVLGEETRIKAIISQDDLVEILYVS